MTQNRRVKTLTTQNELVMCQKMSLTGDPHRHFCLGLSADDAWAL